MPESRKDRDVLVIAGDFGVPRYEPFSFGVMVSALRCFSVNYNHVIYVPGNHEYYHSSFDQCNMDLQSIKAAVFVLNGIHGATNVHVVNNRVICIDEHRFVCTTLWFNERPANIGRTHMLNDFSLINDSLSRFHAEGEIATKFLRQHVTEGDVVVTHHLPSYKSVDPEFIGSMSNCFFVNDDAESLIWNKPAIWIHGHTHTSCDYELGDTRIICNPFGYYGSASNPDFNHQLIVDV
jgi:predicted phosphodiesterase